MPLLVLRDVRKFATRKDKGRGGGGGGGGFFTKEQQEKSLLSLRPESSSGYFLHCCI